MTRIREFVNITEKRIPKMSNKDFVEELLKIGNTKGKAKKAYLKEIMIKNLMDGVVALPPS